MHGTASMLEERESSTHHQPRASVTVGSTVEGAVVAPDGGLASVVRTLSDCRVHYWLDSGVLLGLVRGGALNEWEKDIDLAVSEDALASLLAAGDRFSALGYRVAVNRYRGVVFSVGLKPEGELAEKALRCTIHVFYEVSGYLWSPQVELYQPPPTPDVYQGRRSPVGNMLRSVVERWFEPPREGAERSSRLATRRAFGYRFARAFYRRVDRGWLAETWPLCEVYVPLTWLIPRELVFPVTEREIAASSYPMPGDLDGYLSYRYGDWRTPVRDWCYWEDDGAIRRERPFVVRDLLLRGSMEGSRSPGRSKNATVNDANPGRVER